MWRKRVICALLAFGPSATAARAEPEPACRVQPGKLRYEDKIDCFRNPEARRGFPGALKFIPLDGGGDAFVSLGGEIRQRYEYTHNPLFGEDPQDEAGVWLQRYTLHSDLRLGPHFRVFGQLLSALEIGRAGGPSPVDENQLVLQNGFADISLVPAPGSQLTFRAGRQEMQYGSGRLVDVREGPNVRRTFDATRVMLEVTDWRIDGIAARPRVPLPGVFDDEANDDQSLWGVYTTSGSDLLPTGELDFYYLGFLDDAGTFVQGTARELRHSLGIRFFGEEGGWDWNWETLYQFGSFGAGGIFAWTLASDTGFTFVKVPWRPRLALSANVASGDSDSDNPDLGTFNPLFPRGNYFSEAAVLGPRNFFNVHLFLTALPSEDWSLTADMNFFWRLEIEDGVYSPSGQIIREPGGSDATFVGNALSLTSRYDLAANLAFTAIYTHFFPGEFIRETGPSKPIDFVELTLQWKF